jgi:hypothetical protein
MAILLPKHDDLRFGTIGMAGKDINCQPCKFNRLAHNNTTDELYLVQLIAETQVIKQFRAVLGGSVKATACINDCQTFQARNPSRNGKWPNVLIPSADGYFLHIQKLPYGLCQALFITKSTGFLPVVTEESIWQEISGPKFSTPLLREWAPYIEKKLREENLLTDAFTLGCSCGRITASDPQLDSIVSLGLANGKLLIPA